MSNDNTITFRKSTFYFGVFAAVFVVVILVIFLCQEQIESRSKLASVLEKMDLVVVTAIEEGGNATLIGPEGNEIRACGKSGENGAIIGVNGRECGFKGIDLKAAQEILLLQKEGSPPCMAIKVGNTWFDVHEKNDTQTPRRWKRGHYRCHTANIGDHDYLD